MSPADPQQRAVALRYDPDQAAPEVVAKGAGEVARRILEVAREHDVPVREDDELLALLALCDVGEEIPVELYEVVAELLAVLHDLNVDRQLFIEERRRKKAAEAGGQPPSAEAA